MPSDATPKPSLAGRMSFPAYVRFCGAHLRANWKPYVIPTALVVLFQVFFRIDINGLTQSLPDTLFITVKGYKDLQPGDYVTFEWQGGGPYSRGTNFVKILKGVPGDKIVMDDRRDFYLVTTRQSLPSVLGVGEFLGHAKTLSSKGVPLEVGPTGVIPPGHYYVSAPHVDSLDSRYALTGWVTEDHVVGRAFPIF